MANTGQNSQVLSDTDIVSRHESLVKRIAYKLMSKLPPNVQADDLIQAGFIGLLEAHQKYDAQQGASFETYAGIRIRGSMLDEIRRLDWTPRSVHRKARQVSEATREIESEQGRQAKDAEIAERLGISLEDLSKIFTDASGARVFSMDVMVEDSGFEPEDALWNGKMNTNNPLDHLQKEEFKEGLADAIADLPERERLVVSHYYDDELNLREIGEILGVSESRVCQIHGQAMQRLRKKLEYGQNSTIMVHTEKPVSASPARGQVTTTSQVQSSTDVATPPSSLNRAGQSGSEKNKTVILSGQKHLLESASLSWIDITARPKTVREKLEEGEGYIFVKSRKTVVGLALSPALLHSLGEDSKDARLYSTGEVAIQKGKSKQARQDLENGLPISITKHKAVQFTVYPLSAIPVKIAAHILGSKPPLKEHVAPPAPAHTQPVPAASKASSESKKLPLLGLESLATRTVETKTLKLTESNSWPSLVEKWRETQVREKEAPCLLRIVSETDTPSIYVAAKPEIIAAFNACMGTAQTINPQHPSTTPCVYVTDRPSNNVETGLVSGIRRAFNSMKDTHSMHGVIIADENTRTPLAMAVSEPLHEATRSLANKIL